MAKQHTAKETSKKPKAGTKKQAPKECVDSFRPKTELDGKNDSGPDPEIHGRDIPPQ